MGSDYNESQEYVSLVEKICAVAKKFSQSTYSTFEALDEHRLEFVSLMEMLGYED